MQGYLIIFVDFIKNIEAWFVKLKGTKINHAVVVEKTNELVSELEKKVGLILDV